MDPQRIEEAVALAVQLQHRAAVLQTPAERKQQAELNRMLETPSDKATLVQLTDQAFRPRTPQRVADQFTHILDVQGVPRFFSPLDRAMLRGFQTFGGWLPGVSVPMVKEHMQQETANVILPAEPEVLAGHLRQRTAQGVRMNVNFLGEAILSEAEAHRRLTLYLEALQQPETEVFSVKISTLYSQMSPLARGHTVATLCDRLERLYRSAARSEFVRPDGTRIPKFIYLDMEEYRDLSLTCEVFMTTLDRAGLESVEAGMVLQAYIPDSFEWQQRINEWARRRRERGGGSITLRIVKGANMEMERHEASVRGWPQAPWTRKVETDANYKRMVQEGFRPENLAAVRLGIASHNLFDVAYALALSQQADAADRVQFEMLEGMANHQRRALFEKAPQLLLYAPVCHKEHFLSAIGYLIRRLDENTGPENFLRHAFHLTPGTPQWKELEAGFRAAFVELPHLNARPRRRQDRRSEGKRTSPPDRAWWNFQNEPDTDWSLPHHSEWAQALLDSWSERRTEVPLVVDGNEIWEDRPVKDCRDPSRPWQAAGRYRQATAADVDAAVACAAADPSGWRKMSPSHRKEVLRGVARQMRIARAELMGAALANTGKTLAESDPEVSEAIDFVEFYAENARWYMEEAAQDYHVEGKGVVVVVPPWNFPVAIPCGGVAAALAAGNTVILKPSSEAVLPAWELCQCFWRGGVSRQALQFLPCSGGREGSRLVQHKEVSAVILTGGTSTALAMLEAKPDLPLSAETGGKNATIVTALSDRDQALKNVLHSAFSHAGQKCSATSLLLLEAEVYDDAEFKRALVEAAESITVGSAWNTATKMGPLIKPPDGDLLNALMTLEPGESWALMPRRMLGNPGSWTPGIKWGVTAGSYTHRTEFFGPVLGVMRFENLAEAIHRVNETGYGLTSGLESLDDREQREWQAGIRAGNLYINRSTVGAVVLRQPFGGMAKSAFGPGLKAGGPNYVVQLMNFREKDPTTGDAGGSIASPLLQDLVHRVPSLPEAVRDRLIAAFVSFEDAWKNEFATTHDHFLLVGQDNQRRYLPFREVRIRWKSTDGEFALLAALGAAALTGTSVVVSLEPDEQSPLVGEVRAATRTWSHLIQFKMEADEEIAGILRKGETGRVRYCHREDIPKEVRRASAESQIYLADAPVLGLGRVELLWYLEEQSLSFDYHRYGNLGARAGEKRSPLPESEEIES